jgi:hypothetical protein
MDVRWIDKDDIGVKGNLFALFCKDNVLIHSEPRK